MAVLARHSLVRPVGKQRSCWLRLRKPGEWRERKGAGEWLSVGPYGVVRLGLDLGGGLGLRMEVLGLGAILRLQRPYSNLGWALGWDKGLHCSGDRIQG